MKGSLVWEGADHLGGVGGPLVMAVVAAAAASALFLATQRREPVSAGDVG